MTSTPIYTATTPTYTYGTTPAYTYGTTPAYTYGTTPAYSSVLGISGINPANGISLSFPLGWSTVAGPSGTIVSGNIGPMYAFRPGDSTYEAVPNGSPLKAG